MSHRRKIAIAQKLVEGIGSGRDLTEIAALFDADLEFELQGDAGVLPWLARAIPAETTEPRLMFISKTDCKYPYHILDQ